MKYKIIILLASYNGEQFIREQLNSILNQSYTNWELLISDDGSIDCTMSIINDYISKDSRIHIVNEDYERQGACQNFGNLLKTALVWKWDFIMFADQDDFWRADKIQLTLDAMIEGEDFVSIPKLVYSDFEYADFHLNPLPRETDINILTWQEPNLPRLLAQNNIYGCTMMINKVLAEKVNPIPDCVENHDYWISMVAALLGEIVHLKERTILYRQHSSNVSGHYSDNSLEKRFKRYCKKNDRMEKIMKGRFKMAGELNIRFYNEIPEFNQQLLFGYSNFEKKKVVERISFCLKNGIEKDTILQNLAFYYLLARL
jgi:glycosyltransferase involved in cell wall biosynthesis